MKKIVALLFALTLVLSACGGREEKLPKEQTQEQQKETEEKKVEKKQKESTKKDTKMGRKKEGKEPEKKQQTNNQNVLDKEFKGKYASFKVAKDWQYGVMSILSKDDTSYFYFDEVNNTPFLMYQFEITDPSVTSLTDSEWDNIFKNSDAVRSGTEEHNGIKYQYGVAQNLHGKMDMLVFYTLEKGVLQAFALAVPLGEQEKRADYKDFLIEILNTVTINQETIKNAFSEGNKKAANHGADLPTEFDSVDVKGFTLPVPKGWIEASNDDNKISQTLVFKENHAATEGFMFQRSTFELNSKEQLDAYILLMKSTIGEEIEINGVKYYSILPSEDAAVQTKIGGYTGSYKGKTYSYFYISLNNDHLEQRMAFLRKIMELVKYE